MPQFSYSRGYPRQQLCGHHVLNFFFQRSGLCVNFEIICFVLGFYALNPQKDYDIIILPHPSPCRERTEKRVSFQASVSPPTLPLHFLPCLIFFLCNFSINDDLKNILECLFSPPFYVYTTRERESNDYHLRLQMCSRKITSTLRVSYDYGKVRHNLDVTLQLIWLVIN